ncbi:glycosyltransferase involved in cell wall biosynthesis [Pararhizobium capsulatum DSM 1112]|uniref:Glycosyltransferase involved in cell wall biosynthesis n=1 Tax=Pararhizobium capsulatum DSM 1112 TaxID=1121113 RepID=A0ABU0BT11_9HYPH|nr:glycosyltransferase family 4 protein [Pararhizobium capsulatum]MDQ0321107.1 glycosyltransferase involved in cell wall biosynthesis [Pararhizobium capsulatum DSM 1112]
MTIDPALKDASSRKLRVLFILPHPIEGPSSRFRVYQFLPFLKEHGIEATLSPLLSSALAPLIYEKGKTFRKVLLTFYGGLRRIYDVLRSPRYDVVYVLREAFPFGPPWLERLMAAGSGRMIFDYDDAIYVSSTAYDNPLDRFRDFSKTEKLIRMADHVSAGSRYLAAFAARHKHTPGTISVVPTVVGTADFRPAPPGNDDHFTIGWIGTPRGTAYLRSLRDAMTMVSQALPKARFVFVGAEPFECGSVPVEFRKWRLEQEVADIQSFDVGIMPLFDDEEARGKCGFKLIAYMAAGLPVVCSPVGANTDIVVEGISGFFAETAEEWARALIRLGEDKELRQNFAKNGRKRVEESFSLAVVAPKVLSILRGASSEKAVSAVLMTEGPEL